MSSSGAPASASPTEGPIVEVEGSPRLLGSQCPSCGTHEFPVQRSCARCGASMTPIPLPHSGEVWSWTVQRMRPKRLAQAQFEPYVVAYVDLGPLKVETRLAGRAVDRWTIGDRVTLATAPAGEFDGPPFWFAPEFSS